MQSRGSSRGSSRGRGISGGSRGGRGGGRGGARGGSRGGVSRGRGGRGGGRGGRGKLVFDSARLAQKEADEEDSNSGSSSEQEDEEEELSSDEEDDEPVVEESGYARLMRSLNEANEGRQVKRRKLEHNPNPEGRPLETPGTEDVDEVEEPEEGPEPSIDGDIAGDDDVEDSSDPFEAHFADPDDNLLSKRLEALRVNSWTIQRTRISSLGRALQGTPNTGEDSPTSSTTPISAPKELKLKQKLLAVMETQRPNFDKLEGSLAPLLFGYQDVLFCERSTSNSQSLRRLTCLHAVNHVFKTRDRVIKNNSRLAKEEKNDEVELRDQGYARPKVLMILPTRESCVRMIDMIVSLCEPEQQENRKRFDDSYVDKEEKFPPEKPEDFRELFEGNDDDMFRLGLKFTRKTVKYFSQFYNSDIIFASPLGLRMALEGKEDTKGDSDFLSSIEMVIVDQADALLMQNWDHMELIFEHLNLQPKDLHGCDITRVRNWYLDDKAKYFRQTIALSAFNTAELNSLFFNQSRNWAGKINITSANYPGTMQDFSVKIKQTFSRIEAASFAEDPDARFAYFTSAIIPALTRRAKDTTGTVIFIPSYLDFVRVRNYFATSPATSTLSFGNISEYTEDPEVRRARSHFMTGRHSVLLYTERAHHFRRYQLRGVKKVIMYSLPDNPIFYKEIVGGNIGRTVQEGKLAHGEGSVRVIFSKWDALKLERTVGTERIGKMLHEKGDTFDFL